VAKKKSSRKQRSGPPTSPNTVLVLFLVFFVLLSIGLGVWGYYGYAGQKELKDAAATAERNKTAALKGEEYAKFVAAELRAQVLGPNFLLKEEGGIDEANLWQVAREDFKSNEDGGKFSGEKNKKQIQEAIQKAEQTLGFVAATKEYKTSYLQKVSELTKALNDTRAELAAALDEKKKTEDRYLTLNKMYTEEWAKIKKSIDKGNLAALEAGKDKYEAMTTALTDLNKANTDLAELKKKYDASVRKNETLAQTVKELQAGGGVGGNAPEGEAKATRSAGEIHALFLDLSLGKTLWDIPKGEILRVDPTGKRPVIKIYGNRPVKAQTTFSIFSPAKKGGAEGTMKGTLEVLAPLGAGSYQTRVTSLYDKEGNEYPLNANTRGASLREMDNAIKDGDLLFNLVWGEHVAIAGVYNLDGGKSENASEQLRQFEQLMLFLERQGITVDAYVDLTDGKIKGALTRKTTCLIVPADKLGEGNKMKDDAARDDREKAIIASGNNMIKDAMEKGSFIISARNFGNVIGYPRFNDPEPFRPRPVGVAASNVLQQRLGEEGAGKEKEKGEKMEKEK
jgi:hypothetical protein